MKKMQSGKLIIEAANDQVMFVIDGENPARAEVPAEDLPFIIEFLRAQDHAHANRRTGFRLQLEKLKGSDVKGLAVTVITDEDARAVAPVDLSITGIRVDASDLPGKPGLQATLRIEFEDEQVELPAVMVRRYADDTRCAFHFPEIFDDRGRLNPPLALTRIYYALESIWLDQNLDFKWNLA